MRLYWNQTGDCLEIDLDNRELAKYWVDQLSQTGKNSFRLTQSTLPSLSTLQRLTECVASINEILTKFRLPSLTDSNLDWLDQNNLNQLHEKWVKIQHQHKIVELLNKLSNKQAIDKFHTINHLVHEIEQTITITYNNHTGTAWQTPNIFGPAITKFGMWHVELHYQNLGRSNFEKWNNFDKNIQDSDTNNFTHMGGVVNFNLGRSYSSSPPNEYVDYCRQNKIEPYGNVLPIGNFNIDITQLRKIFTRNVGIQNNAISFEI